MIISRKSVWFVEFIGYSSGEIVIVVSGNL